MTASHWLVIYENGHIESEIDAEGRARGWAEVSHEQVQELRFLRDDLRDELQITVPPGAEPILFRRNRIEVDPVTEQEVSHAVIPCVGYRLGDQERYDFRLPDGRVLSTPDLQAV